MEHAHQVCKFPLSSIQNLTSFLRTQIHQFPAARLLSNSNLSPSGSRDHRTAITALVQSPAIDVVGIGYTSGEISVYDIRADERLMRMFMEGGGIRALGFRSGSFNPYIQLSNVFLRFKISRQMVTQSSHLPRQLDISLSGI